MNHENTKPESLDSIFDSQETELLKTLEREKADPANIQNFSIYESARNLMNFDPPIQDDEEEEEDEDDEEDHP